MRYLLLGNPTLLLVSARDRVEYGDGLAYRCRSCNADMPRLPRAALVRDKHSHVVPSSTAPCPSCGTIMDIEHLTPVLK